MTDLAALDSEARERSLDPSASILLEAPAGSGKTTVLTQRILRLLALVDEPEEVLAITFTRKAAAEMRERVLGALRAEEPVTSAHARRTSELAEAVRRNSASRNWGLEHNPARLRIQTIDSLNHSIASRLPIAARSGGHLVVHDRSEDLHRMAARRTLEDAEAHPELESDIGLLFERLDNDWRRFEGLLAEMLNRRAHWLPLLYRGDKETLACIVERGLRELVVDALRAAARAIPIELLRRAQAFAPLHALKCEGAAARLLRSGAEWPEAPGPRADDFPWWQCLASLALTREGQWRRQLNALQGYPPTEAARRDEAVRWIGELGERPGALEALVGVAGLPPLAIEPEDAEALEALARVLRFAAAELEVIFREQGRVDHSYVASAARRALVAEGEPTDLALRLGTAIRHILIDEFQDTSSEQFELVRALTIGWEEGDGRTLFAVGDPMQSIYQFREAEVGLFLRARDFGIGSIRLLPLRLTRNFRSVPALVEWGNETFASIFPRLDEPRASAVRHAPSVAARSDGAAPALHLHGMPAGDVAAEAARVVQIVAEMRRRDPAGSIAVLVAARQHASAITSALRGASIALTGVDLVPLAEVPVVRDLAALTRALEHPGDRTAWLAVLRAPWCGLTLGDLTLLLDPRDRATIWQAMQRRERVELLSSDARARLERLCAVLARALDARARVTLARLVESTWLALGGPSAASAPEEIENAEAFLRALAQRSAEPGWTGADALEDMLGSLYASDAAAPADAVQIMTMHRAKGLEFDRVILPSLGRRPRAGKEILLRWLDLPREREGSDLLMAPCPAASRRTPDPLNEFLKRLQKRRACHERARLLYVATTRARLELHLLGQTDRKHPERPVAGTLLALLWPALGRQFLAATAASQDPAAAPGTASPAAHAGRVLRRLPGGWQPPQAAPDAPLQGLRVANYEPAIAPEFNWVGQTARHVGTVVHAALERIGRSGTDPAGVEAQRLAPAIRSALAAQGIAGRELAQATRRAVGALQRLLADERGRWILDPTHAQAASELALSGILDGRLVSVSIDRSFIDADGRRWVVDFKTSSHEGTDLDAFLDAEVERYRAQLSKYAALARALGPEPVHAALYFPLLGAFRECQLEPAAAPRA